MYGTERQSHYSIPNSVSTPTTDLSDYNIEWNLEYGSVYKSYLQKYVMLKINIKANGKPSDLNIIVSDPEGKTIGEKFIPKEDLFDGLEIVRFQMSDYDRTPKPGKYTAILVSYPSRELLYKETHTFNVANLSVHAYIKTYPEEKYLWKYLWIYSENTGDLPIFIHYASVKIFKNKQVFYDWKYEVPPAGSGESILLTPPNEKYEEFGNRFYYRIILNNLNLKEGSYYVRVWLHYSIEGKGYVSTIYTSELEVYKNGSTRLLHPSTQIEFH